MMPECYSCSSHLDSLCFSVNLVRDILLCRCPQGTCRVPGCRLSWDQDPVPVFSVEGMIRCPPEQFHVNADVALLY